MPHFLRLSSTCCTCTINLERSMLSWIIADIHSSSRSLLIPLRNMLISSMLVDTREVVYLDFLTNFREYSLNIIDPCLRWISSSIVASLSLEENLLRKAILNSYQVIRNSPIARLSCHILHQVCATSLSS